MSECLSDEELAVFVERSAPGERLDEWNRHVDDCDSCAARLARRFATRADRTDDPEATRTHEPARSSSLSGRLPPGTQLGDFRLEAFLGVGGMGTVYRAQQISLNRLVALKVLPPALGMTSSAVVRFRREAQAAAKLHHTNIVAV